MKKILGFGPNVFFLGLISLFNDFSAEMVISVMPVFLTAVLGAPALALGLIEGFANFIASFLKIFSGWFSDKIRARKIPALAGYSLSVLTRPFLSLTTNFWQVFALRAVDRVGKGFRDAPRDALLAESVPKERLGISFGFNRAMDSLGATLGPLTAFLILPAINEDYRLLFLIAFFIGLPALFSFWFIKEIKPRPSLDKRGQPVKFDWSLLIKNRPFLVFVLAIFIFGLGTLPVSLALLRGVEVGLGGSTIPLVYFIYSLTFVVAAIPFGRLADKIGERLVISFGFLMALLAYLGLAWFGSILAVMVLFVFLGFYSAATDGVERALAAKLVAPEVMATGQGVLNAAVGFSSLLAGVTSGFLWTSFSSAAAFGYGAFLSFIGLVIFLVISFRKGS